VLRYEAQPTRMFGSYSVTAHYDDGTAEALAYGDPQYCLAEAARRNGELEDRTDERARMGAERGCASARG
jgi:hypothetical protein